MYPNLKLQLWRCGIRQNRLAQMLDMDETVLSKIVNGFRVPNADMRSRIAGLLECDEQWLFAKDAPLEAAVEPKGVDGIEAPLKRVN
ncbi:MAG: helix-turn-helix transcriptional regulator [Bryobacterales bacterium]|nr:helix-turn-helix transcriptional regulator [Bryobacterales bacterium]